MSRWVLVTREQAELGELQRGLPDGVRLVAFPVLRLSPWESPEHWEALERQLAKLSALAFTSRHAPGAFVAQARARGLAQKLLRLPAAAVGAATARACREAGFAVALEGDGGGAQLAQSMLQRFPRPLVVAFPCGREHREELVQELAAAGATVLPVPVYAMELTPPEELPPLPEGLPSAVVVTSPRATQAYWQATGGAFAAVPHLALGPTTAAAVAALGVAPKAVAKPTAEKLLEELCRIL